jgi:ABC-type transport system substrate-binding protein
MSRRRPYSLTLGIAIALAAALLSSITGAGATSRQGAPPRGGTLHVAYSGAMQTLDPAQAFNDDWWVMNGTLYNALYRLDRNGVPQLDLAAAPPTIGGGGTVWTFHLRKGVLFSNGMEVTAGDLKYSITRTLNPHLKPAPSWGQPTDDIFVGSHAFVTGKAGDVPGIQVLDRYTIRFRLVKPVSVFPYIMAETFNMVLPEAVVSKESPDAVGSHPIGTGPFTLQSWQKGNELVFVRNPRYFRLGKPHVDKLIVDTNVAPNLIALKVEKGEIDGFGNGSEMDAPDLQQARSDPRYARYLVTGPVTWLSWLNLNVHAAPLDDVKMRQAIAMAINRPKLARLLGGNARPTGNLYIPIYAQNDPALDRQPVYPYDPTRAAALVKASGYHGQTITLHYPADFGYNSAEATGIQQDLQRIGLNVSLRSSTTTSLTALGTKLTGHQLSIFNWSPDYPDAYDVYTSEFLCSVNGDGGISRAHYCDPAADALVARAGVMSLGAARNALLRAAQRRILQSAAYVPLVYNLTTTMVNPRVGGFYYHPMYGWQFEDYWVKR